MEQVQGKQTIKAYLNKDKKETQKYNGKGAVGEAMIAGPAGLILGPSTFLRQ